jgi:hypothetical protein
LVAFTSVLLAAVGCGGSNPEFGEQDARLACEAASRLAVEVGGDFGSGDAGVLEKLLGNMKRYAGDAAAANSNYQTLEIRVEALLDSQLTYFLGDAQTVDPIADLATVQAECETLGFGT